MPSSISSSNHSSHRAPDHPWTYIWLLAGVVVLFTLGGVEGMWRSLGHRPSVVDDEALWSMARQRVADHNPKTVALLGASRIQLGFSLTSFEEKFPDRKVVQLAVDGRAPLACLRDLAQDEAFRGVVICGLTCRGLMAYTLEDQQPYVDYYHRYWTLNAWCNRTISAWIQERLTVVEPRVSLRMVLSHLVKSHELPGPNYVLTRSNRSRDADYQLVDRRKHAQRRVDQTISSIANNPVPAPDEWLRQASVVEPMVERIQARGGRVVFVRFPMTGELWDYYQRVLPKDRYWDRFTAVTRAATIHFHDVPSLRGFDCPDLSHLDGRDAPQFTAALCDELIRRGVLEP